MRLFQSAFVLACVPAALVAQEAVRKLPHVVRASADAVVTAKPDRAEINIGVSNQAPTAEAASQENARQTTQVVNALKAAIGNRGEIRTSGFSIFPEYQNSPNKASRVASYRASNTVFVTIDDISIVGSVIDSSVKAGANNLNSIQFTLRDDSDVRNQALAKASVKARASAEAIARALNVKVIHVLEGESASGGFRPMAMAPRSYSMSAESVAAPTPVEAGNLEIRATVTVTLEVQ